MKKIQILGTSRNFTAILYDLLLEEHRPPFSVYQNLVSDVIPEDPVTPMDLIIYPPEVLPEPGHPCYFGAGSIKARVGIFNYFEQKCGIQFTDYPAYIHASVYLAPSSSIAHGCIIEPQVAISSQTKMGFGVVVRRGAQIGHHNVIGAFTEINPGAIIAGRVTIGERCSIGAGAVVRDGLTIGDNTIVGMGSVVTKDLPANVVAFGNPCKIMKTIE